ncbi:MAG: Cof-type HAD-IIB family hydrolase [Turicibacter sp.]|nr:Cof-type HAD-IIB family hydrolase [Turicibacter sp.]
MLKLVATDMDGTLLNSQHKMPKQTYEVIDRLHAKGIKFAVASGRHYLSLQNLYKEIKDEIILVAENGGVVIDKGEMIYASLLGKENARAIIADIDKIPGLKVTICALQAAYLFEGNNIISDLPIETVDTHFPKRVLIKSLDDLPDDDEVIKLAVFDPEFKARENIYGRLPHLHDQFQLAVSGAEWTDIMNLGINKGVAIRKLQDMLAATPEETMVFGDALNDVEMMQQAYYSYAMENALPEVKAVSNFTAPTNEEEGVVKVLENLLAIMK